MKPVLYALALCLAGCATTYRIPARVERVSLAGTWEGRYFYPDDQMPPMDSVPFTMELKGNGQVFSGTCREPNTFGDKSVTELNARIDSGMLQTNGYFQFVKQMDGSGGVRHAIHYTGTLSADGKYAIGTWQISTHWSGSFEMRRAKP